MKKLGVILSLFLLPTFVFAQSFCSDEEYAELREGASAVKVNFVERQDILPEDMYAAPEGVDSDEPFVIYFDYIELEVLNLTKEFYVIITNTLNNQELKVQYSDTSNGKYIKRLDDLTDVSTYTFKIYTSGETKCKDEELKDLYLTIPRFNSFSGQDICKDLEDVDVCQKYVTFKEIPFDQMQEKAETAQRKFEAEQTKAPSILDKDDVKTFFNENKTWIYLAVIMVVIIGGLAIVVISKRRRKI